jgi:predicted HAD superfamily Cof-like phosphohydrolase
LKHLTNYDKVRQFHKAFGHPLDKELFLGYWFDSEYERASLRVRLLREEFDEVVEALYNGGKAPLAKEIADLLYVTYGLAATYGIHIDEVFNRVHESNMSKLGEDGKPVYRNDGKVLKGPNYKEPEITDDMWYEVAERIR